MSSSLKVSFNGKEVEGWKKYLIVTVVTVTGIFLLVFAFLVVALGLVTMFTGGFP